MFYINTYIRKVRYTGSLNHSSYFSILDKDELSRNAEWFDGSPVMYIPGYLEVVAHDQMVTRHTDWDYPFYMWNSFLSGVDDFMTKGNLTIPFLEEPLAYQIDATDDGNSFIYLQSQTGEKRVQTPRYRFPQSVINSALLIEAINVFTLLSQFDPTSYTAKTRYLNSLLKRIS